MTTEPRYEIRTGKFGQYFHDAGDERDLALADNGHHAWPSPGPEHADLSCEDHEAAHGRKWEGP